MIDFEKYMIAEEGLFGKLSEVHYSNDVMNLAQKLDSMNPEAAAKVIITAYLEKKSDMMAKGSAAEKFIHKNFLRSASTSSDPLFGNGFDYDEIKINGIPVLLELRGTTGRKQSLNKLHYCHQAANGDLILKSIGIVNAALFINKK